MCKKLADCLISTKGVGHGRLVMSLGGLLPLKKFAGADVDRGELQRYLAYVSMCAPMLLNHESLEFTSLSDSTLRVRDREDPHGATVDLEIGQDGRLLACRAERPRLVGKQAVQTPWFAAATALREFEGMRIASSTEAAWDLSGGQFTYFRAEVISLAIINPSAPSL